MHYKCFKSNLDVEKYLFIDLNFRCRKTLANFPCSSHNLLIEKGQHQNIERDYKFCLFCLERNVYSVEDEFHFFMECPLYTDLRDKYFKQEWKLNVSLYKFYSILKLSDTSSIFDISKFLVSAFEIRNLYYES